MASLGNLYFDVGVKLDEAQLENVRQKLFSLGVDIKISPEDLQKSVSAALTSKPYTIDLGVNKERLTSDISSILSKSGKGVSVSSPESGDSIDKQMGYIEGLTAKMKELEAQYKSLGQGDDPSGIARQFQSLNVELTNAGKNLSSVFAKSFSDINAMSENTISSIKSKISFLEQYKVNLPVSDTLGIKTTSDLIDRLKSTLAAIGQAPPIDPFSLAENTLDNISTKIKAFSGLKQSSVIGSADYTKAISELERLKSLQSDILNPKTAPASVGSVLGMSQTSLDQIASKLSEIRKLRSSLDVSSSLGMSDAVKLTQEEIALNRLNKEYLDNIRINSLAEGSVAQLRIKVSQLTLAYDQLSAAEREGASGSALLENLRSTTIQLSKAEEASLRFQRNVGNYKSAFNGLQFQVNQLVREVPSMAYGPQMFFAAISNNLPMFNDEVKKAKENLAKLREEQSMGINLNQKAVPVWKQVIGAIFSWQSALVVGLTLLMLYGKDLFNLIGNLFSAKNAFKLTTDEINKMHKAFSDSAGSEIAKLDILFSRLRNAKIGTDEWHSAKAAIVSQFGGYLKNMDSETASLNNQTLSYMALTNAVYQSAKAKAIETANTGFASDRLKKQGDEYLKIQQEFINKFGEKQGNLLFDNLQKQIESGNKLSPGMVKIIDKFNNKVYDQTGESANFTISNSVLKSIEEITKAQDIYNNKVAQTGKQFAYLDNQSSQTAKGLQLLIDKRNILQAQYNQISPSDLGGKEAVSLFKQINELNGQIDKYNVSKTDKANKSAEKKAESEAAKAERERVEALKERVNLLKEAYSMYKEWAELVGKTKAIQMVRDSGIYNPLFADQSFDLSNYRGELDKLYKELGTSTKPRREVSTDIIKALNDLNSAETKDAIQKSLGDTQKYISDTIAKWDLFESLYKTTGDKSFSMKSAFGGESEFKSVLEQLTSDIKKEMESNKRINISFSDLVGMSPENVKKDFGEQTSELVNAYQEQGEKLKKSAMENAAKLIETYRDYESRKAEVIRKGEKDIADLQSAGANQSVIDEVKKRNKESVASIEFEKFKDSGLWTKTFEDLDRLSSSSINNILQRLEDFKDSAGKNLPLNDFKQLMETIKRLRDESENRNPFKAISDGIKDLSSALGEYKKNKGILESAQRERDFIKSGGKSSVTGASVDSHAETSTTSQGLTVEKTVVDGLTVSFKSLAQAENEVNQAQDNVTNSSDKLKSAFSKIQSGLGKVSGYVGDASSVASSIGGMFDSLGDTKTADSMEELAGILGGVGNIAQGIATGNPVAVIQGVVGVVGTLAAAHDKKLDRAIEASVLRVKRLKSVYDDLERSIERYLGNAATMVTSDAYEKDKSDLSDIQSKIDKIRSKGELTIFDVLSIRRYSQEVDKLQARIDSFNTGGAYGYERQLLKEQIDELKVQRQAEEDKKKTDASKIADYNDQIAELEDQIANMSSEIANSLYGIDIKSWASQISDSLVEAFSNGTDAAKAFDDAVASVMKSVVKNMISVNIIQPLMNNLKTYLFGTDGQSGVFGKDFYLDPSEAAGMVTYIDDLKNGISSAKDLYDSINKATGGLLNTTSSGLTSGIQSVTEDTADLLASYINSMRADLAQQLSLVRTYVEADYPQMSAIAQAQLTQLVSIANNTAKQLDVFLDMYELFTAVSNGTKSLKVK